jgi:hypothetical protein
MAATSIYWVEIEHIDANLKNLRENHPPILLAFSSVFRVAASVK